MKKIYTIILLALIGINANSQSYQWAKSHGGTGDDNPTGVTTDNGNFSQANVFVTGYFDSPTITFGGTTLNNPSTNPSPESMYLVKYDYLGNVLWARVVGGTGVVYSYSITKGFYKDVYIAGMFSGSVTFGTTTLTSAGSNDIFLVQYAANGTVLWAKSYGGSGNEGQDCKVTNSNPGIVLTGTFQSSSITFGSKTLTHTGTATDNNGFIAYYDSANGGVNHFDYAQSIGGNITMGGVSDFNATYITGTCLSASSTFGVITLTNGGMFIAKYDHSGNVLWAKNDGGTGFVTPFSISSIPSTTPNTLGIYVTGYFGLGSYSTATFGSITLTDSPQMSGSYQPDIFLVKYDFDGNVLWAKSAGGRDDDEAYSVSVSDYYYPNVCITGIFKSDTLNFDNTTLYNTTNTGKTDLFIAEYDPNGNELWAKSAGGTNNDEGISIDCYGSNIYVAGYFQSPSINFGNTTLTTAGSGDGFLTKIYSCNAPTPSICEVTVDSLSKNNIIMWDKTPYAGGAVDSFIVYREVQSNVYKPIGAVPFDSLSLFIDTVRTKYFVSPYYSLGDPNAGTYRYKLQVHDTCGNYSALSPYHNTIFMTNNSGTFSWPQLYTIENAANPVTSYLLMRDNLNNGNWQVVNSVTGTQQSVTDPAYSTYSVTANYRIETQWSYSCTPTLINPKNPFLNATTVNTSKSNTFRTITALTSSVSVTNASSCSANDGSITATVSGGIIPYTYLWNPTGQTTQAATGLAPNTYTLIVTDANSTTFTTTAIVSCANGMANNDLQNEFSIYPNPSNGSFTISSKVAWYEIIITNPLGEEVYSEKILNPKSQILNLGAPDGVYFMKLVSDKGTVNKKIIIAH